MKTHDDFMQFNSLIRLTSSKKEKLKANRQAVRKRIKGYFEEKSGIILNSTLKDLFR